MIINHMKNGVKNKNKNNTLMLKFKNYKLLESNNYKYDDIVVKVDNRDELVLLYDYLNKLSIDNNRSLLNSINYYPNYIFIKKDYINGNKYLTYLSTNPTIEEINRYIYNSDEVDSNILSINQLLILRNILLNGNKNIDYNTPKKLVYEQNTLNEYPYKDVVVKVDNKDQLILLYKTIQKIYYTPIREKLLGRIIKYPNYIFINTLLIKEKLDINMNEYFNYLGNNLNNLNNLIEEYIITPNNVDSDILTTSEKDLMNLTNILTSGKKFKGIDYNTPKELVYESTSNFYPLKWILIKVESSNDINKIYDYLDKYFKINFKRDVINSEIMKFPNYIFLSSNITTFYNTFDIFLFVYGNDSISLKDLEYIQNNNGISINTNEIVSINKLYILGIIFKTGKYIDIDYNKPKELVYESKK